ncbi:MAG: efflux RND transporter periplasmic adaptor subunit [bacterium]
MLNAAQIAHGGVKWSPVSAHASASLIEAPGQLVFDEDRTARLGAPVEGRVLVVHVQVGDRVSAGRALVTLQSGEAATVRADYDKAVADLAARKAAATYARSARDRADRLLAAKAAPRQELERAIADDELARSELARAQAEVARTRGTVQVMGVSSTNGTAVVRAPRAGTVMSRDAVPGAVVQPGTPLVSVSDPSALWLDLSVPPQAAASLAVGSRVRFGVPAFPTDTFEARVLSVGGGLDSATRALAVRAKVEDTRGRLRAQMFATVWLEGSAQLQTIAVPEAAVMLLDEKPVVFVAHAQPGGAVRFERRDVTTVRTAGGVVEILTGLRPGELVVTTGAFAVKSEFSRGKMAEG